MIANLIGFSSQTEVLIIIFLGVFFLVQDFSLFHLKSNLEEIWNLKLTRSYNLELELVTKYVLIAVVLVRTLSLHLFIACYIIMLWPAIFEEKPNLCLPWLLIGIVRSLVVNCITFLLGNYICHNEVGLEPICTDFVLSQIIEHGPSVYAWFAVLSFYRELLAYEDMSVSEMEINSKHNDNSKITEKSQSLPFSDIRSDPWQVRCFPNKKAFKKIMKNIVDFGIFTRELRTLSYRSSDSLVNLLQSTDSPLDIFESVLSIDSSLRDRVVYVLGVTEQDIELAKKEKNRMLKALEDVQAEDSLLVDDSLSPFRPSKSFYAKKGKILKGSNTRLMDHLKSISLYSDANSEQSYNRCLCFLKKHLQRENSNQSLLEQEIYNIYFDSSGGSSRNESFENLGCSSVKTNTKYWYNTEKL